MNPVPVPARLFWARLFCLLTGLGLGGLSVQAADDDVLLADFEGPDYGAWQVEGQAFGPGPAQGTLPNQMPVDGFAGHGLANSYYQGDGTTGRLTSPDFQIERDHMNFLIGGGGHAGQTCMNLLVDGQVVRTATGPNTQPGGGELLDWQSWDVRDLRGQTARLQVVDEHTGGWGHINVDQIVLSARPRGAQPVECALTITHRYWHLPVRNGAPKRIVRLREGEQTLREFEIELADGPPELYVFCDLREHVGRELTLQIDRLPTDSQALDNLHFADDVPDATALYAEPLRPQFHFTSRRGWLNDPNGLVYAGGKYHLFYQHNPYGIQWGNMHWGRAESTDLLHWEETGIALYPPRIGDWAFSGSAVVDERNTSGWQVGDAPPIVIAFTSTGRGECIVYSADEGRTWQEYAGNPVVQHAGRDPRLLWHAPTQRWVMAVYDEHEGRQWIAFYTSADLKSWEFASRIADFFECPDLFELPVQGGENETRWILHAADGRYVVGRFDGREFTPEQPRRQLWYGDFYAAQTFSNEPSGRRVQIGWGRGITFPGMPFNQQMTVPVELTLVRIGDVCELRALPVRELELNRVSTEVRGDVEIPAGDPAQAELWPGELLDATLELAVQADTVLTIRVHGDDFVVDASRGELRCRHVTAPLSVSDGRLALRLLVDRGSIEIFANEGALALSAGGVPRGDERGLRLAVTQGEPVTAERIELSQVRSIWPNGE